MTLARWTKPVLLLALTIGAIVLVGAGAVAVISAKGSESGNRQPADVDTGLSDAERDAKYAQLRLLSATQQAQIEDEFVKSGTDVSSIPHVDTLILSDGHQYDLLSATLAANLVVEGNVVSQRLRRDTASSHWLVVSTIRVSSWLKGDRPAPTIELEQSGTPTKQPDGSYALGVIPMDPVVAAGSDVIVFGTLTAGGTTRALPYSTLVIEAGLVTPSDLAIEMAPVRGATRDEVMGAIRSAVAADGGG